MVNYQRDLCLMTLEPHLTYNIRVKDTAEQLAEKLSQEYRAHMQRRGALRQEFFENLAKRIQSEEFN